MEKLRIIVGGFIGLFPTGGATFDYIQYPLGLKLLGHDVYYIEDTGLYPIYQAANKNWNDASDCIRYLKQTMNNFGFKNKWAYRDIASGKCYGLSLEKVKEICRTADVFINLSCSTFMRDEYLKIPKRVLLDSDPMFTQIQYFNELSSASGYTTRKMVESHNYLFSFGENIGKQNCEIPTFGFNWRATRQPVCLDLWKTRDVIPSYHFTSIMNWSGRKKLLYNNIEWGQKDVEFNRFIGLPKKIPSTKFEIVINPPLHNESNFNTEEVVANGWEILKPADVVAGYNDYKNFIQNSFAEFSIAKETYVKSNSGWFPCRSACYLAAGKPVVTQETGWTSFIPSGNGIFSFNNMEEAVDSVNEILNNYTKHAKAAKDIAINYFDSNIVLDNVIKQIN